jgi:hypothetical protein
MMRDARAAWASTQGKWGWPSRAPFRGDGVGHGEGDRLEEEDDSRTEVERGGGRHLDSVLESMLRDMKDLMIDPSKPSASYINDAVGVSKVLMRKNDVLEDLTLELVYRSATSVLASRMHKSKKIAELSRGRLSQRGQRQSRNK